MSPPALDAIVTTCLAKDPEERWQSAGDVGRQLKWIAAGSAPSVAARLLPRRKPYESIALVVIGLAIGALISRMLSSPPGEARTPQRFTITVPESEPLRGNVAISADGQTLIYIGFRNGVQQLFHRPLGAFEATPVSGTEGAASDAISPDGEWAVFGGRPVKVSLSAGARVELSSELIGGQGACWLPNGYLVTATEDAVSMISSAGGDHEILTELEPGEEAFADPQALPNGKGLLLVVIADSAPHIEAFDFETRE